MSDGDQDSPRPHRALIALLAIVVLIAATMYIVHRLHEAAQIQDCVASGRTNCAPIEPR